MIEEDVMNAAGITGAVLCVACALFFIIAGSPALDANQAGSGASNPDELRFQLIGNEPIAGPDGRALVRGWSALMFKDRESQECYLAFSHGSAIAAVNVTACPQ
jgi:hypothetical protein